MEPPIGLRKFQRPSDQQLVLFDHFAEPVHFSGGGVGGSQTGRYTFQSLMKQIEFDYLRLVDRGDDRAMIGRAGRKALGFQASQCLAQRCAAFLWLVRFPAVGCQQEVRRSRSH